MEWLRKLLGLETAPSASPNIAPLTREVRREATEGSDNSPDPTLPTGWTLSERGNETTINRGLRITIYPEGRSWKYCIADPAHDQDDIDFDDDKAYRPYFSDGFPSKEIARVEAMNKLHGRPRQHQSSREIREAEAEKLRPQHVIDEEEKLEAIRRSIDRLKTGKPVRRETVENLLKRTLSRVGMTQQLWINIYADNNDQELIKRSKLLMEAYHAARDEIRAILEAMDTETKE